MNKKKICVIGSGPCGITTCQELLKYKYDVTLVDIDTNLGKVKNFNSYDSFERKNISPKYNNNKFRLANLFFLKTNNILKRNFFLSSVFSIGGLTNFWGGGIEFPSKKYFKNFFDDSEFYKFFLKEKKNHFITKIEGDEPLKTKKIEFYNPFFLTNSRQIDQFRFMKFYLDNRYIYNAADQLKTIINKKNFTFNNKSIVKSIIKDNTSYKLVCINLNFEEVIINEKFDQIYICAGAIGSKLLVNRIINNKNNFSFKLYHTPMSKIFFLQIPFFKKNINHMFKINNKINIGKGYMLHLNNVDYNSKNFFINLLISFFNKFIVVGTFFYHPSVIDTFFSYNKNNSSYSIKFNYKRRYRLFKKHINKILFNFCLNNYLLKIPFLSITENITGSDAHYTSTLYKSNLLNKNNEILNYKNIFVNDTSVIKPGLFYPTFLSINYARFMVKINNKK